MPPLPSGKKRIVLWTVTVVAGVVAFGIVRDIGYGWEQELMAGLITAAVVHYWLRLQLQPAPVPGRLAAVGTALSRICLILPLVLMPVFVALAAAHRSGPRMDKQMLAGLLWSLAVSPVCGVIALGCLRAWRPAGILVRCPLGIILAAAAAVLLVLMNYRQ